MHALANILKVKFIHYVIEQIAHKEIVAVLHYSASIQRTCKYAKVSLGELDENRVKMASLILKEDSTCPP